MPAAEEVVAGLEQRVHELETALEQLHAELSVIAAWCEKRQSELPAPTVHSELAQLRVEVLGPDCRRCDELFAVISEIAREEPEARLIVVRVSDVARIADYGPVLTPALAVNDRLIPLGRVPVALA